MHSSTKSPPIPSPSPFHTSSSQKEDEAWDTPPAESAVPTTNPAGETPSPLDVWQELREITSDLGLSCALGDLLSVLQAVQVTAQRGEGSVALRARDGFLYVLGLSSEGTAIFRVPAPEASKGLITVPAWEIRRFLESVRVLAESALKIKKMSKKAFESQQITIHTRRRPTRKKAEWGRAIVTLSLPSLFWSYELKHASCGNAAVNERFKQACRYIEGREQEEHAGIAIQSTALQDCFAPLMAARQRRIDPFHPPSPDEGLLLSVEGRGEAMQRISGCIANSEQMTVNRIASPFPFVRQAPLDLSFAVLLPLWSVLSMWPLFSGEDITIAQREDQLCLRARQWAIHMKCPQDRRTIPAYTNLHPSARVTAEQISLCKAVKALSRAMREANLPYDQRIVRVSTYPEKALLKLQHATIGPSKRCLAEIDLSLTEGCGQARNTTVPLRELEAALFPIKHSVELTWWDPPAPYPLLVRPRVPSGYVCAIQHTPLPEPPSLASSDRDQRKAPQNNRETLSGGQPKEVE